MSIKLILANINCHTSSEFIINKFQISLLKGASGIGKSSLFQAFTWCLYGKLKGICTFGESKYSVTIIFEEFTIYRQGKPKLLQICIAGNTNICEDEVAQHMIDQYFGTEDIWYASCYIEQDTRSPLLSGTNNQRMDLLNKLSFWSDNPDFYLDKIDDEIKLQQAKLLESQTRYKAECDFFSQQLIKTPINMEIVNMNLDTTKIEVFKNRILDDQKQLEILGSELQIQHRIMGSLDTIKSTLSKDQLTISNYKTIEEYNNMITSCEDKIKTETINLEKAKQSINLDDNSKIFHLRSELKELESLINQKKLYERTILIYSENLDKYIKEKDRLKGIADRCESKLEGNYNQSANYNRNQLSIIVNQEQHRNEGINICKNLQIDYDPMVIKSTIEQLNIKIKNIQLYKADLDIIKNIDILKERLVQTTVSTPDVDLIKQLESKYHDMILSQGVLRCPHCKGSLRYTNYTLEPHSKVIYSSDEINNTKQQLDTLKKDLERYQQMIKYQSQIDELVKLFKIIKIENGLTVHISDLYDNINQLDNYNKILQVLQKIKYVDASIISSIDMLKIIEYQEAKDTYDKFVSSQDMTQFVKSINEAKCNLEILPKNLEEDFIATKKNLDNLIINAEYKNKEIKINLDKIQSHILTINNEKSSYINKKNEINYIINRIIEHQTQIKDLESKVDPTISIKIDQLRKQITLDQYTVENGIYYLDMLFKQRDLEKKAAYINSDATDMSDLYALRQTTFDLECNHLQTTVDSINESMNAVLEDIFDKPIKVILQLYKKNKTNEKVKASVNLNIQYDGNEYDSIAKLSGGEKDRVSFALTLALSRINGCPLLFLDETMTSLNDTLRTACIESVKKFLGNSKTILCINHEDVEGNYDNVIEIK